MFLFLSISLSIVSATPLQQVANNFGKHHGFDVDFAQQVNQEILHTDNQKASGRVHFERPDHLRWVYETPRKRLIEYRNHELLIDDDGQKQKIDSHQVLNLQESFSFLWGQPNSKLFDIQNQKHGFRLIPRKGIEVNFKWIDVSVKDSRVVSATIVNRIEGESILQFKNWKFLD